MPYLRRMTYFSALRITHRVFAGVYKYRAPTEIFFGIYDTPTRTCHSGRSPRVGVQVLLIERNASHFSAGRSSFMKRVQELLSRMQIIPVFIARCRRKRTSFQQMASRWWPFFKNGPCRAFARPQDTRMQLAVIWHLVVFVRARKT